MRRALELARGGWGRVAPNPMVGAVVLRGAKPVGAGYHTAFGEPHAEVAALTAAGAAAWGGTLVVSLEPCAHTGKTPPCTDAIRQAGIARVVAAIRDPDPQARGGVEVLRAAGVDVATGLLAEDAAALNAPFLFSRTVAERPFVALKLATSIDGRIADATGQSHWVSGDVARAYVHWLRAGFAAVAVGGNTARRDDPQLTVRGVVTPRVPPLRVVFDRRAHLASDATLARTARELPTWVAAAADAPDGDVARLEALGVRVTRSPDLAAALGELRRAGVESLLVEGGGALGGLLLAQGLVDRLYWIQAPIWLGNDGVAAFPGVVGSPLAAAPRWIPVERRELGADTLLVLDRSLCLPAS